MTLEMIFLAALISFFINITTDMLNDTTLKLKVVIKDNPIQVLIDRCTVTSLSRTQIDGSIYL